MKVDIAAVEALMYERMATALREEQIRFHMAHGATREIAERLTDQLTRRKVKVLK